MGVGVADVDGFGVGVSDEPGVGVEDGVGVTEGDGVGVAEGVASGAEVLAFFTAITELPSFISWVKVMALG